ncbi:MarR family transcriptional regulator [Mycobacterium scrofulaceum]|uniref:MarR family transcriptional regulator n=1 Tax=Mycobacterium scrofulaceum TaxID=1783 RepID=A0A1X0KGU7_MYCSC|nr:MarR family transcriptional regulator [Mycobacterium scrofulaceum]ORB74287.1 MarR family transcriptional regulator [Mycobacterium scrofulaceum]
MTELAVLQAVRLKGRVRPAELAATLTEDVADVAAVVDRLTAAGLLVDGPMVRLTPAGRERLASLLEEERSGADRAALRAAYDDFRPVNADFKAVVTQWQLKGGPGGTPNTHDDAQYDAAVLARLDDVHARVLPIVESAAAQLPRLRGYSAKLAAALGKVHDGETAWLTRPLVDSYHTVWFELHEELITAAGMTREEAARSGDAQ